MMIKHLSILFFFVQTETHSQSLTLALYLHTLVSFTSPNTWAILKTKSLATLKPGMQQLCSNILGALVQKGFYLSLRVFHFKFYTIQYFFTNLNFFTYYQF